MDHLLFSFENNKDSFHIPVAPNVDLLKDGISAAHPPQTNSHPMEVIQRTYLQNAESLKTYTLNNVYGTHFSLRLQTEKAILSKFQRLPALPSEFAGLETISGTDEDLGFEDYLNVPLNSVEFPADWRDVMECRLGLGVRNLHARA